MKRTLFVIFATLTLLLALLKMSGYLEAEPDYLAPSPDGFVWVESQKTGRVLRPDITNEKQKALDRDQARRLVEYQIEFDKYCDDNKRWFLSATDREWIWKQEELYVKNGVFEKNRTYRHREDPQGIGKDLREIPKLQIVYKEDIEREDYTLHYYEVTE